MMDYIFNSFKIKYINLNNLFGKLDLNNINKVTLYINLESVLSKLHRDYYEETLLTCTKSELANNHKALISNIINLAAHYRLFFTRSKVASNIVFYYSDFDGYKRYNNTVYIDKYRKTYFDTYHNPKRDLLLGMINEAVRISHSIIDYIDRVFILSSDRLESSVIPYMAHKDQRLKSDLNLILTRDIYDFQYVNHGFLVLYPEKEESIILHKKNLMKFLRFKNDYEDKYHVDISPKLLPFILSIIGDKKRSLPKVTGIGFKKIYKSLEKLYDKEFIIDEDPSTMSIEHLAELLKTNNGFYDNGIREIIGNNYFAIDLDRQLNIASDSHNHEILDNVNNKFDTNGLKKLNDKVFSDYPLHLIELNNYSKNKIFEGVDEIWTK